MSETHFVVNKSPSEWSKERDVCHGIVTDTPWKRNHIRIGEINVIGRNLWRASDPLWANEVVYYNTSHKSLFNTLDRIVVHHTNNSDSISENEKKQKSRGYAALGYHFFIRKQGDVYEGRPIEIMGSHAGQGIKSGPLNDPDWGAIGIVLQGDYHHSDDWIYSDDTPEKQFATLKKLICALRSKYNIHKLLMHKEVIRSGKATVCPGDHLAKQVKALRSRLKMTGP